MLKESITILNAWIQKIPNPRQRGALGISVTHQKGVMLFVQEHKHWNHIGSHRGYIWMDIRTCIDIGLIPDEFSLTNNPKKLDQWVKTQIPNKKIHLKSHKTHLHKHKENSEHVKFLKFVQDTKDLPNKKQWVEFVKAHKIRSKEHLKTTLLKHKNIQKKLRK